MSEGAFWDRAWALRVPCVRLPIHRKTSPLATATVMRPGTLCWIRRAFQLSPRPGDTQRLLSPQRQKPRRIRRRARYVVRSITAVSRSLTSIGQRARSASMAGEGADTSRESQVSDQGTPSPWLTSDAAVFSQRPRRSGGDATLTAAEPSERARSRDATMRGLDVALVDAEALQHASRRTMESRWDELEFKLESVSRAIERIGACMRNQQTMDDASNSALIQPSVAEGGIRPASGNDSVND